MTSPTAGPERGGPSAEGDAATFEPGDHVRCVRTTPASSRSLTVGQEYVVTGGGSFVIRLDGIVSWQYAHQFARVTTPAVPTDPESAQ